MKHLYADDPQLTLHINIQIAGLEHTLHCMRKDTGRRGRGGGGEEGARPRVTLEEQLLHTCMQPAHISFRLISLVILVLELDHYSSCTDSTFILLCLYLLKITSFIFKLLCSYIRINKFQECNLFIPGG